MSKFQVEYRTSSFGEWINADYEGFEGYATLERAEARNRLSKYDYRIVEQPDGPKVVKEFFKGGQRAEKFEVGETYAHAYAPTDFRYKIAYEFTDGRFLLVYDDEYNDGKLTSLKYWPDTAKYFIKKPR